MEAGFPKARFASADDVSIKAANSKVQIIFFLVWKSANQLLQNFE